MKSFLLCLLAASGSLYGQSTTTVLAPTRCYDWVNAAPNASPSPSAAPVEAVEPQKTDLTVILINSAKPVPKVDDEIVGTWVTENSIADVSFGPIFGNIGSSIMLDLSENREAAIVIQSHAPLGITTGGTFLGNWEIVTVDGTRALVIHVKSVSIEATRELPEVPKQFILKIEHVGPGSMILSDASNRYTFRRQ